MDPSKPFGRRKSEEDFNFVSEEDKAEAEELGISGEVYYYFKAYVSPPVIPTVKSVIVLSAALFSSSAVGEMVVAPELGFK